MYYMCARVYKSYVKKYFTYTRYFYKVLFKIHYILIKI